jgi:hypothetical protein
MRKSGRLVVLTRWLRIAPEEATFARRKFRIPRDSVRNRLERVGATFLAGYHVALRNDAGAGGMQALAELLSEVELEFRGFAYEGAAMALDLLDQITPWKTRRLPAFMDGPGQPHIYMVHVGMGWSLARLSLRVEQRLARLDPLLRWLALDGYGFHEGYFHWPRYATGARWPRRLHGYELRAFDQGLGRSLWFVGGADTKWIAGTIGAFPGPRRADLWSGVGLASAYAGGADAGELIGLRQAAGTYYPHLAQGVVFAAGARIRAGNPAEHTELACQLLCELSIAQAAAISEKTRDQARAGSDPAYEVWRGLIREHFDPVSLNKTSDQRLGVNGESTKRYPIMEAEHAQRP